MEWLINVKLPIFLGDEDEFPHTDMVVAPNWCPGWILDQMIKEQACEIFDCLDEALMCIFEKRIFAASARPIEDLGFFNCCTVSVEARNEWNIYILLPRGFVFEHPLSADPLTSSNHLNNRILYLASWIMGISPDSLYVLYNGTPLARATSVPLYALALHNNSYVTVFQRVRGGICVAQNSSGRKRSVSQTVSYIV